MNDNSDKLHELFDSLRWPFSALGTSITFSTLWCLVDLIKYEWSGYPLRENTLLLAGTMGVAAIFSSLVLAKRIKRLKTMILDQQPE